MATKAPYTNFGTQALIAGNDPRPPEGIPTRLNQGRQEVFDPVRRRWVVLTPEEWVRQQTIAFLHGQQGYPLELMQVEAAISLAGMTKRCDIVIYDRDVKPWMIVECKKESIALTQKVVDQASRYNLVLKVPYLMLTNGQQTLCLYVDLTHQSLTHVAIPLFDA